MKLTVSPSPHMTEKISTSRIMLDVIIALIPALIAGTIFFGPRSLLITAVTIAACVLSEYVSRKLMKRSNTIIDLSAVVTGLLLALNLPVDIPVWIAALGGVIAIVVAKQMFGGLGQNFVNPALFARVVLLVSFTGSMAGNWAKPLAWLNGNGGSDALTGATDALTGATDAMTTATPLTLIKSGSKNIPSILDMFIGNVPGSLGETCVIALLIGAAYLMIRKVISPVIPVVYIGTVCVMSLVTQHNVLHQILSGSLMIGAFFMATDYATSPLTKKGQIIYAIGCGLITSIIRFYGKMPEGVSYAIILMNILVPLIERFTKIKYYGLETVK